MPTTSTPHDLFAIERRGGILIIVGLPALERLDLTVADEVAEFLLEPIRRLDEPLVVIDLAQVQGFGSIFLALLLRCWKIATVQGGMMVLSGASERVRDLLRVTRLELVWPIYDNRADAIEALLSD